MTKPRLNCAIYTRKSTDEGLEQSFNSLDAQREACEAYIVSQKHEGWHASPIRYDDGGFSGGNMGRPALHKLLGDIEAGKVNIVVVYKVDRLTRSLSDFAKIVERFDRQGVSFVSVTQQFNTTSSMGRLTLNVLLSFAQFEREVAGERIRDKIAASKKKGMWMGGNVPLGYAAKDRTLVPIPNEAKKVINIYERYLALGSVRELQAELRRDNILSKSHVSMAGRKSGGHHFSRGALHELLQNPIYIGDIRHRDKIHPGLHEAIVSEKLWKTVQERMAKNRVEHSGRGQTGPSLLTSLVFDGKGERLTPTSTVKCGRRYRYYVLASTTRVKTDAKLRLPAGELEELVIGKLCSHMREEMMAYPEELLLALEADNAATKKSALMRLVEKIVIFSDQIVIHLKDSRRLSIDYRFSMSSSYRQLVTHTQPAIASERQKQFLLKAFVQGYIWRQKILKGKISDVVSLARAENKDERYVSRLINLSLMAPDLVAHILKGNIPAYKTIESVVGALPILWVDQQRFLSVCQD